MPTVASTISSARSASLDFTPCALNADFLHDIRRLPEAGRIDDMYRYAFDYQFVPQRIARCPGNFRNDRHFFLCEAIQQTRFADVRLADQHDFRAIAQNPALLRFGQQSRHCCSQATQLFQCAAAFEKIDFFLGKIQSRLDQASQFDERIV